MNEFERLQKESAQAMKDLERELARQARNSGVDVKQLVEFVLLKELAPQEFARLHKEASRIASEEEARLLKMKSAARALQSAINAEAKTADPFKLHDARVQLQKLNAEIRKLEK